MRKDCSVLADLLFNAGGLTVQGQTDSLFNCSGIYKDDVNTPYNQSAIIEIAKIDERNMDNVLIFYEEEFSEKQCKTLFRGIISRHDRDKNWVQESFSKSDEDYTLDVASSFCYNCLLEDCRE